MSEKLFDKALQYYNNGDLKAAQKCVAKILRACPFQAAALMLKGNILFQQDLLADALIAYQQALQADSTLLSIKSNIANVLFEQKDYQKAYEYAAQAIEDNANDFNALVIYGNAALELEKYNEAKAVFLQALEIDSGYAWGYNALSRIYQKQGDFSRALACSWRAVELAAGDDAHHLNFGYLLYEIADDVPLTQRDEYATKWLISYGKNPIVNHMASAILHNEKIRRAEGDYVQRIFDAFADDFEDVLHNLDYCAPQLIANELDTRFGESYYKKMRILDAGCGTGLCGNFLKKYAHFGQLCGIDISEKMLDVAQRKKIYNKLQQADIETCLPEKRAFFDLIVAADVLTYIGDLNKVINNFSRLLQINGYLMFTVSKNYVDETDYYLHNSGRFLHHKNYVEQLLDKHNFTLEKICEHFLRNEGDNQVMGYLIVARKKI